mmetsp:Transcript_17543/g.16886  ORF Transcript_17543/g.16886 Transcript_17543/m.16886 type:complete len:268 (-) Transcript_17543:158-961(-)|eukprot:CAMPEP_0119041716 /NCGR_PEP_ID=MMETSP1177-20130426/13182_1 /TAXON_ID=2985 /ORGANISM="Ochromonas sp, Strain CCMP1899" /LENGTH=267 /DNA_ID=CAMNT_0007007973 /DNA_START=156 /DNA_END=959 /DNA_ORIENTATION=+
MSTVTPDAVNALLRPTDGFLCPLSANAFGIDFLSFTISDYETKKTVFEVGRDNPSPQDVSVDFSSIGEDMYRKIKYDFSEDVLRLPYIQTSLTFAVGPKELREFRMIERHYFRDQLIKSFDFEFGFCIPASVNTWDAVYSLPALSEKLIQDMIENPFETKSDSFYFVNNSLIMHNKASYKYIKEDAAQAKKSYEDKFQSKGSKAAKVTPSAAGAGAKADTKGINVDDLNTDMKAVTMASADAKEVTPRSGAKAASKEHAWSKEDDYF